MISGFIGRLFEIKSEERLKAYLMFFYIFLIIASLLILKPIRNSLFLVKMGIYELPYAYTLVAITAIIFIKIYSIYANRIRLNVLMAYTLIFFMITLLLFWIMLRFDFESDWFLYIFFIWVAIFGVVVTSQFWLLANYVFNAREAKRLFGFIGAGGISGGIFGGYLTNMVAPMIGTEQMMFFCLFFWAICLLILRMIWKQTAALNYEQTITQNKRLKEAFFSSGPLKTVLESRHLIFIAGIVGVGALIAAFVDYQYSFIASEQISEKDDLTAFFGFWLSNLSFISLLFQFFLTGRILKVFGITTSLHFLPVGISIGAFAILVSPTLFSAIIIKVAEGSFKQSINKAGVEILYLPIPSQAKNQAKAFIDVSVDGFATGIGGILLILLVNTFYLSVQSVSIFILIFVALWFYFIYKVREEYVQSFRLALERRDIDLDQQNVNLEDAGIIEIIMKVLEGNSDRQILYVLNLLEGSTESQFLPTLKRLLRHPRAEIRIQTIRLLRNYKDQNYSDEVTSLCQDPEHLVRIEAARYLAFKSDEPEQKFKKILKIQDIKVASSVIIALALEFREKHINPEILDPQEIIDSHIEKGADITLNQEERDFIKMNLAKFIGIVNDLRLNPLLLTYFKEESETVQKTAIQSAGMTRDPIFLKPLFMFLDNKKYRKYVREALAEYGEMVVPEIAKRLLDQNFSENYKILLVKILSRIGSQSAINLLWAQMNSGTLILRFAIIKALNKLNSKFSQLKFGRKRIEKQIRAERDHFTRNLSVLKIQQRIIQTEPEGQEDGVIKARQLLVNALQERLDMNLEIIFRLLGLKFPSQDIYNAYLGIVSRSKDLQASAIEFLDNVLDVALKPLVIPLVENYFLEGHHGVTLKQEVHFETDRLSMQELLEADDNWLKMCLLYVLGKTKDVKYISSIKLLKSDSDSHVQEMANFVLHSITQS